MRWRTGTPSKAPEYIDLPHLDDASPKRTARGFTRLFARRNGRLYGIGPDGIETPMGGSVAVQEVDGSPSTPAATKLVFPNATLSVSGTEVMISQLGGNQLASITAASAAIANTETVVVSATIAAGTVNVGQTFRIRAAGVGTTGLTPGNSTFRIRIGPTTLTGTIPTSVVIAANASVTNQPFSFSALVTVRTITATGTIIGECIIEGDNVDTGLFTLIQELSTTTATVAVDSTVANLLELTFQSGAASSSCTFYVAEIESLNAAGTSSGMATDTIWDAAGDTVVGTGANAAVRRKNNDNATAAPAVTDDSAAGYAVGSRWLDTTNDREYAALDVSVGAAVWRRTSHTFRGAHATKTATFPSLANATLTTLEFDAADIIDTDGYHDPATNNSRFTVPAGLAGFYVPWVKLSFAANATGARAVFMLKNGTIIYGETIQAVATATRTTQLMVTFMPVALIAGDYIEFQARQDSGGALSTAEQQGGVYLVG